MIFFLLLVHRLLYSWSEFNEQELQELWDFVHFHMYIYNIMWCVCMCWQPNSCIYDWILMKPYKNAQCLMQLSILSLDSRCSLWWIFLHELLDCIDFNLFSLSAHSLGFLQELWQFIDCVSFFCCFLFWNKKEIFLVTDVKHSLTSDILFWWSVGRCSTITCANGGTCVFMDNEPVCQCVTGKCFCIT